MLPSPPDESTRNGNHNGDQYCRSAPGFNKFNHYEQDSSTYSVFTPTVHSETEKYFYAYDQFIQGIEIPQSTTIVTSDFTLPPDGIRRPIRSQTPQRHPLVPLNPATQIQEDGTHDGYHDHRVLDDFERLPSDYLSPHSKIAPRKQQRHSVLAIPHKPYALSGTSKPSHRSYSRERDYQLPARYGSHHHHPPHDLRSHILPAHHRSYELTRDTEYYHRKHVEHNARKSIIGHISWYLRQRHGFIMFIPSSQTQSFDSFSPQPVTITFGDDLEVFQISVDSTMSSPLEMDSSSSKSGPISCPADQSRYTDIIRQFSIVSETQSSSSHITSPSIESKGKEEIQHVSSESDETPIISIPVDSPPHLKGDISGVKATIRSIPSDEIIEIAYGLYKVNLSLIQPLDAFVPHCLTISTYNDGFIFLQARDLEAACKFAISMAALIRFFSFPRAVRKYLSVERYLFHPDDEYRAIRELMTIQDLFPMAKISRTDPESEIWNYIQNNYIPLPTLESTFSELIQKLKHMDSTTTSRGDPEKKGDQLDDHDEKQAITHTPASEAKRSHPLSLDTCPMPSLCSPVPSTFPFQHAGGHPLTHRRGRRQHRGKDVDDEVFTHSTEYHDVPDHHSTYEEGGSGDHSHSGIGCRHSEHSDVMSLIPDHHTQTDYALKMVRFYSHQFNTSVCVSTDVSEDLSRLRGDVPLRQYSPTLSTNAHVNPEIYHHRPKQHEQVQPGYAFPSTSYDDLITDDFIRRHPNALLVWRDIIHRRFVINGQYFCHYPHNGPACLIFLRVAPDMKSIIYNTDYVGSYKTSIPLHKIIRISTGGKSKVFMRAKFPITITLDLSSDNTETFPLIPLTTGSPSLGRGLTYNGSGGGAILESVSHKSGLDSIQEDSHPSSYRDLSLMQPSHHDDHFLHHDYPVPQDDKVLSDINLGCPNYETYCIWVNALIWSWYQAKYPSQHKSYEDDLHRSVPNTSDGSRSTSSLDNAHHHHYHYHNQQQLSRPHHQHDEHAHKDQQTPPANQIDEKGVTQIHENIMYDHLKQSYEFYDPQQINQSHPIDEDSPAPGYRRQVSDNSFNRPSEKSAMTSALTPSHDKSTPSQASTTPFQSAQPALGSFKEANSPHSQPSPSALTLRPTHKYRSQPPLQSHQEDEGESVHEPTRKQSISSVYMKLLQDIRETIQLLATVDETGYRDIITIGPQMFDGAYYCLLEPRKIPLEIRVVEKALQPISQSITTTLQEVKHDPKQLELLMSLSCPNIVTFLGDVDLQGLGYCHAFEYSRYGRILHIIRAPNAPLPSEAFIAYVLYSCLCGLKYLHEERLIHRNLACESLIVNQQGYVKLDNLHHITPFPYQPGLLSEEMTWKYNIYPPPELRLGHPMTDKSDIWDLGILIIQIVNRGYLPIASDQFSRRNTSPSDPFVIPGSERVLFYSSHLVDFLLQCLQADPDARPSTEMLLNHHLIVHAGLSHESATGGNRQSYPLSAHGPGAIQESPIILQQYPHYPKDLIQFLSYCHQFSPQYQSMCRFMQPPPTSAHQDDLHRLSATLSLQKPSVDETTGVSNEELLVCLQDDILLNTLCGLYPDLHSLNFDSSRASTSLSLLHDELITYYTPTHTEPVMLSNILRAGYFMVIIEPQFLQGMPVPDLFSYTNPTSRNFASHEAFQHELVALTSSGATNSDTSDAQMLIMDILDLFGHDSPHKYKSILDILGPIYKHCPALSYGQFLERLKAFLTTLGFHTFSDEPSHLDSFPANMTLSYIQFQRTPVFRSFASFYTDIFNCDELFERHTELSVLMGCLPNPFSQFTLSHDPKPHGIPATKAVQYSQPVGLRIASRHHEDIIKSPPQQLHSFTTSDKHSNIDMMDEKDDNPALQSPKLVATRVQIHPQPQKKSHSIDQAKDELHTTPSGLSRHVQGNTTPHLDQTDDPNNPSYSTLFITPPEPTLKSLSIQLFINLTHLTFEEEPLLVDGSQIPRPGSMDSIMSNSNICSSNRSITSRPRTVCSSHRPLSHALTTESPSQSSGSNQSRADSYQSAISSLSVSHFGAGMNQSTGQSSSEIEWIGEVNDDGQQLDIAEEGHLYENKNQDAKIFNILDTIKSIMTSSCKEKTFALPYYNLQTRPHQPAKGPPGSWASCGNTSGSDHICSESRDLHDDDDDDPYSSSNVTSLSMGTLPRDSDEQKPVHQPDDTIVCSNTVHNQAILPDTSDICSTPQRRLSLADIPSNVPHKGHVQMAKPTSATPNLGSSQKYSAKQSAVSSQHLLVTALNANHSTTSETTSRRSKQEQPVLFDPKNNTLVLGPFLISQTGLVGTVPTRRKKGTAGNDSKPRDSGWSRSMLRGLKHSDMFLSTKSLPHQYRRSSPASVAYHAYGALQNYRSRPSTPGYGYPYDEHNVSITQFSPRSNQWDAMGNGKHTSMIASQPLAQNLPSPFGASTAIVFESNEYDDEDDPEAAENKQPKLTRALSRVRMPEAVPSNYPLSRPSSAPLGLDDEVTELVRVHHLRTNPYVIKYATEYLKQSNETISETCSTRTISTDFDGEFPQQYHQHDHSSHHNDSVCRLDHPEYQAGSCHTQLLRIPMFVNRNRTIKSRYKRFSQELKRYLDLKRMYNKAGNLPFNSNGVAPSNGSAPVDNQSSQQSIPSVTQTTTVSIPTDLDKGECHHVPPVSSLINTTQHAVDIELENLYKPPPNAALSSRQLRRRASESAVLLKPPHRNPRKPLLSERYIGIHRFNLKRQSGDSGHHREHFATLQPLSKGLYHRASIDYTPIGTHFDNIVPDTLRLSPPRTSHVPQIELISHHDQKDAVSGTEIQSLQSHPSHYSLDVQFPSDSYESSQLEVDDGQQVLPDSVSSGELGPQQLQRTSSHEALLCTMPRQTLLGNMPAFELNPDASTSNQLSSNDPTTTITASDDADAQFEVKLTSNELVELDVIGRGQSGAVTLALHIPTISLLAIKKIQVHDPSARGQLSKELHAYSRTNSPFVMKLRGAFLDESDKAVLASDYMDMGSLKSFVNLVGGPLPEYMIAYIARASLIGLDYLHGLRYIHRDIKPDNILLNSRGHVQIADLGLLIELESRHATVTNFLGTLTYLSPERIRVDPQGYGISSDIYSLGLTLIFCATGKHMYTTADYWTMLELIVSDPPCLPQDNLNPHHGPMVYYSPELRDLIALMVRHHPNDRPTAKELLQHPFFSLSFEHVMSPKSTTSYLPPNSEATPYSATHFASQLPQSLENLIIQVTYPPNMVEEYQSSQLDHNDHQSVDRGSYSSKPSSYQGNGRDNYDQIIAADMDDHPSHTSSASKEAIYVSHPLYHRRPSPGLSHFIIQRFHAQLLNKTTTAGNGIPDHDREPSTVSSDIKGLSIHDSFRLFGYSLTTLFPPLVIVSCAGKLDSPTLLGNLRHYQLALWYLRAQFHTMMYHHPSTFFCVINTVMEFHLHGILRASPSAFSDFFNRHAHHFTSLSNSSTNLKPHQAQVLHDKRVFGSVSADGMPSAHHPSRHDKFYFFRGYRPLIGDDFKIIQKVASIFSLPYSVVHETFLTQLSYRTSGHQSVRLIQIHEQHYCENEGVVLLDEDSRPQDHGMLC